MKKIISRYYLFVAILLIIADQFFIRLVLHSDFAAGLSDFSYYFSDMMLNFLLLICCHFPDQTITIKISRTTRKCNISLDR